MHHLTVQVCLPSFLGVTPDIALICPSLVLILTSTIMPLSCASPLKGKGSNGRPGESQRQDPFSQLEASSYALFSLG